MARLGYQSLIPSLASRWHEGEGEITFSFIEDSAPSYYRRVDTDGDGVKDELRITRFDILDIDADVSMSVAERGLAELALTAWNEVAHVNLVLAAEGETGDIAMGSAAFPNDPDTYGFITKFPDLDDLDDGPGRMGDLWINSNNSQQDKSIFGHTSWNTYLHELGHSLGLSHPDEDPENFDNSPDNSNQYSVMSYVEHPSESGLGLNGQGWPLTPMLYDIAATQELYGANLETRDTDTSYFGIGRGVREAVYQYGINGMEVEGRNVILTIWDAGGRDLIDTSDLNTAVRVDLAPGKFSTIGAIEDNIAMAYAVRDAGKIVNLVEDAWGTVRADWLSGNVAGNRLEGGQGSDDLYGKGGRDRLFGQGGADDMEGGAGRDILVGGAGNDRMTGGSGADEFRFAVLRYEGVDRIEDFEVGVDVIRIVGGSFDALDFAGSNGGSSTRITLEGGTRVVVEQVAQAELSADDFLFV